MIVVRIIALIISIAVPGWVKARVRSRREVSQENLTKIDGSKQQWALEAQKAPADTPTQSDLASNDDGTGYLKYFPSEPTGGSYIINNVNTHPQCSTNLLGHFLTDVARVIDS